MRGSMLLYGCSLATANNGWELIDIFLQCKIFQGLAEAFGQREVTPATSRRGRWSAGLSCTAAMCESGTVSVLLLKKTPVSGKTLPAASSTLSCSYVCGREHTNSKSWWIKKRKIIWRLLEQLENLGDKGFGVRKLSCERAITRWAIQTFYFYCGHRTVCQESKTSPSLSSLWLLTTQVAIIMNSVL